MAGVLGSAVEQLGRRHGQVTDLVRNFGSPAFDLGLDRLRAVDSIHFLGGGYLNRLWPAHAGLVAGALAARTLSGARLFGTGLSIVPAFVRDRPADSTSAGSDAIELLREFDHISVRDEPSAEVLGVPLGLDDAFLGVEEERRKGLARGGADLVVCLQSDLQSAEQGARVIASGRATVAAALADGRTVQYVEAIPGVDWPAYDALRDLIDADHFIPFMSVWRDGLPLRPDQTWLTTRFHLHFLAAAAGASGTAIAIREGFYDVKHQSLLALGTQWSYRNTSNLSEVAAVAPGPTGAPFASDLGARIALKRQEAATLYPADPPAGLQNPSERGGTPGSRMMRGFREVVSRIDQSSGR